MGLERWTQGISNALEGRGRTLGSALADYYGSCAGQYVCKTELDTTAGLLASRMARLGQWTSAVGKSFLKADAIDLYIGAGGAAPDSVVSLPDSVVVGGLPPAFQTVPFLGDTGVAPVDWSKWKSLDGEWLTDLSEVSDVGDGAQTLSAAWAKFLPRGAHYDAAANALRDGADATAKWVGRASNALSFASGAADTWSATGGQSAARRIPEVVVGGVVDLGLWNLGFAAGTSLFAATGPFAPLFGAAAGWALSNFGTQFYDNLIGTSGVSEEIDQVDQEISNPSAELPEGAAVQLNADQQALKETASEPGLHEEVESATSETLPLLPAAAGERPPSPPTEGAEPPAGTRTTVPGKAAPPARPAPTTTVPKSPPVAIPPRSPKEKVQAAVPAAG